MTKTLLKSASALAVVLATSPAFAGDPVNVERFTTAVDAEGDPNLQGPVRSKTGQQLYVDNEKVEIETRKCNGILEVFYREATNGNVKTGTFWGVNITDRDDGVIVGYAGKNDKADMIASGNYIAYEISKNKLGAEWQDVVSKDVDVLRIVFPDQPNCSDNNDTPTPDKPSEPELPGGGCKSGCAYITDVKALTYDEVTQKMLSDAYALNIG